MSIWPNNPYMPLLAFSRVLRVRKLVKLLGKMEKSVSNMSFICSDLMRYNFTRSRTVVAS